MYFCVISPPPRQLVWHFDTFSPTCIYTEVILISISVVKEHEWYWEAAPCNHQQLPWQTMATGEQPVEKVHLLGQPRRGCRHQSTALREGDPVSRSLLLGQRGCLQNHQLLKLRPPAQPLRLQEGHSSRQRHRPARSQLFHVDLLSLLQPKL